MSVQDEVLVCTRYMKGGVKPLNKAKIVLYDFSRNTLAICNERGTDNVIHCANIC